jgi:hypothetical protein
MIVYVAVKRPETLKGKPKTLKHTWVCSLCKETVHTEPLIVPVDEDEEDAIVRTNRIKRATERHVCAPANED